MITATQTPQEIVNAIVAQLNNCPSDVDPGFHFQLLTQDKWNLQLTETLCSSDTFDTILTINNEHWLIIDDGNGYSCDYLASGELLYGWTDEMLGQEELTDEQKELFQENLQDELKGIKVVNRELTTAEKQWNENYFCNEVSFAWNRAMRQTF